MCLLRQATRRHKTDTKRIQNYYRMQKSKNNRYSYFVQQDVVKTGTGSDYL